MEDFQKKVASITESGIFSVFKRGFEVVIQGNVSERVKASKSLRLAEDIVDGKFRKLNGRDTGDVRDDRAGRVEDVFVVFVVWVMRHYSVEGY